MAPAGTPAGQGREARSLHRPRRRCAAARPLSGTSGLAPGVPGHLRDRPAQPGPADPLRDPQRTGRCGGGAHLRPLGRPRGAVARPRPAAVLARHPPAGLGLRRAGLQPLGRAHLHEPAQHGRPRRGARCGPPTAAPSTCSWPPVATAPTTPSPSPTSSTSSCSATARRSSARSPRSSAAWKASGRSEGSREHVLRELSHISGVYVPSMYDCTYEGGFLVATTPRYPDVPEQVEKRTVADLADFPYPKNQLVPITEVVHDRLNVEVFRGCTRGCRFCQAGMITRPVRERPAEQVRTMVADGLKRTGYDEVALTSLSTADYSGIEQLVGDIVKSTDQRPARLGLAAQPPGRRLRRGHRHPAAEGPPHRPHLRPRGRHLADAPGHQQAHPRGRPLQRRRRRLRQRLAPHEALLPHRPAHRDRRGHPRHRRAGPQLRRDRQEAHQEPVGHGVARWLRAQAVHPVPVVRPEHGRGAAPQDQPPARRHSPQPRREREVARPQGHPGRGHHEPRRSPPRPGHRRGLASGRHVPGVEREVRPHPVARGHGQPRPRPRLVRPPPPHRARGPALGPPLGRAPQGLPLAGLARRPRRGRPARLPLDPLLRLRRLHRLLDRAHRRLGHPARRRLAGHRPGPQPQLGARSTCSPASRRRQERRPSGEGAPPLPQARQGPLHQPPRHRPLLGAGPSPRRAPGGQHRRFLAPPEDALRAGALHRP